MTDLPLNDNLTATPDRFLWHQPSATAILSDLHLGAAAELTRRGIFMPEVAEIPLRNAWQKMAARLYAAPTPPRLIIAGDLFDSDTPDAPTIALATELLQSLPANCTITLIPGNHDPAPETLTKIFQTLPVTVAATTLVGNYSVIHGHDASAVPPSPAGLIVGHQHPAVTIRNRVQTAKMICFASGNIKLPTTDRQRRQEEEGKGGERGGRWVPLVILPAFSRAPLGSNLLTDRNWILDLPRPADADLRILGIIETPAKESQILDFGTLAALRLPF